jgi:hypothetical protein
LARRSSKHYLDVPTAYPGTLSDFGTGQFRDRLRKHDTVREVVGVDSAVDRVYFDRSRHIEARLLKAQSQASGTRE